MPPVRRNVNEAFFATRHAVTSHKPDPAAGEERVAPLIVRFILPTVQRVLLIQLKRLGDFILTAPAVAALRATLPQAEFVLIVPGAAADLARCLTMVDRVIPYHSDRMNLETWASALAGEWDACLDFTGTDRSALLTKLSRAQQRLGYARHAQGLRRLAYTSLCDAPVRELHTVDFHLALVRHMAQGAPVSADNPVFAIPPESRTRVSNLLATAGIRQRYAIIHPGTAREEKFWVDERWADVCGYLHERHHLDIVLTGSGDGLEKPHLDCLRQMLRVPVSDLTGRLSLVDLASLIEDCEIIIGVDSMAMHLAAMLKKPQIALFGPTNPFHWRPRHDHACVMLAGEDTPVTSFSPKERKRDMKLISTQAVIDATRALLPPD